MRMPEKRNGKEQGTRSFSKVCKRVAPFRRKRSNRVRIDLEQTGRRIRDDREETDHRRYEGNAKESSPERDNDTIGAIAMIGIVCSSTAYG